MPNRQVRPGTFLPVFGSANGGVGTANLEVYSWTFSTNPDVAITTDGSTTGVVANDRYIVEDVQFSLLNGSTREVITATLQVSGPSGPTATVLIDIVDPANQISDTPPENLAVEVNIAIEDGLRAMYLYQNPTTGAFPWSPNPGATIYTCATTAFSVWAMSNSGHRPTNPTSDIYAEWVQKAVDHILNANAMAVGFGNQPFLGNPYPTTPATPDANGNGRIISACGPQNYPLGYGNATSTAALIAAYSANSGAGIHAGGPFGGSSYKTIIEDTEEYVVFAQDDFCGGGAARGGWQYTANSCGADTSVDSWNYVALEGFEAVLSGVVNDNVKKEVELRIHNSQNPGGQFGYQNAGHLFDGDFARTAGGLSGLVLTTAGGRTPHYLNGPPYTGSFANVAARKAAAVTYLGNLWHLDDNACCSWDGNRNNFYAMWTTARALRLNGTTQLVNGGVTFDWQTGESPSSPGFIPGAGDPREGYFNFLVRTQQPNGNWDSGGIGEYDVGLSNAWAILILQPSVFPAPCEDNDNDGVCNDDDNCIDDDNVGQEDADNDGEGDACDACPQDPENDADGDGVCETDDNCDTDPNADQVDGDGDGLGDACDACPADADNDADGDGVCGNDDNCPTTDNPGQGDADNDGLGDACDACPADANNDADGDGVCGNVDNCPTTGNPGQADGDNDGLGDACDACPADANNDADGDGVCGNVDNCPTTANPDQTDTDGNGVGDACTPSSGASGGAFVVGDLANLAGNAIVNFWGSQWSTNNPMSGGAGPNAFKGFENSLAVPTCGATWTSSPGNSSNPPATVPEFMTVIVSSNVTQSGSTISGDVDKVLIVQTQPGYAPAPGHQGYGRVVAVVCSN